MRKRGVLRPVSKAMQAKLAQCRQLVSELRELCNNRSELLGEHPDWRSEWLVEPHHIRGRIGKLLTDPFNIIMLNRDDHDKQDSNGWEEKQVLVDFIRPIRISQGYKERV